MSVFSMPEVKVVWFEVEEILTTSGCATDYQQCGDDTGCDLG